MQDSTPHFTEDVRTTWAVQQKWTVPYFPSTFISISFALKVLFTY